MAQIFVSHSADDKEIKGFFGTIFAITNVKAIYKEIGGFSTPEAGLDIQNDIQRSKAIFVLLGPNVQRIRHTRDWVVWESAIASPMHKDIWVFEPHERLGEIDVIIPHVDHYMVYQQTKDYQEYIRQIIESYDDSQVLPNAFKVSALGGSRRDLIRALMADPSEKRPIGVPIKCPKCQVSHRLHTLHTHLDTIRCPACNSQFHIKEGIVHES
jgi:DNA-directed RNA polymerase subunit RPC12/RpoP